MNLPPRACYSPVPVLGGTMPDLLFLRRGEQLLRVALGSAPVIIGRGEQCDVSLPDPALPRRAARVELRGDHAVVSDLSGHGLAFSNGAFQSGDESFLGDGDEVLLGGFRARFRQNSAPERSTAEANTQTQELAVEPARKIAARISLVNGGTIFSLRERDFTIGSAAECDLTVNDPLVSRTHCRIVFQNGRYLIRDLGSRNGTELEGLRVVDAELPRRALLRIGNTELRFAQDALAHTMLPGFVSADPAMAAPLDYLRRAAGSNAPACILGETGTGKEVAARALHALSPRADGPFLPINCGGLSEALADSELFGHERGAFTGADRKNDGAFVAASGGTLFLDEVGDLPASVQVKLLRVLESGEVRAVGGTTTRKVDVRVLSATHHDLRALVGNGAFREDLYYRLCVAEITLPPLRQRPADILPLAEHFLLEDGAQNRVTLSPAAQQKLLCHPWPGNARELRNVLRRALFLRNGPAISESEIVFHASPARTSTADLLDPRGKSLAQIETEVLRLALDRHQGDDRGVLAQELGVSRATLYRRLRDLGIDPDA